MLIVFCSQTHNSRGGCWLLIFWAQKWPFHRFKNKEINHPDQISWIHYVVGWVISVPSLNKRIENTFQKFWNEVAALFAYLDHLIKYLCEPLKVSIFEKVSICPPQSLLLILSLNTKWLQRGSERARSKTTRPTHEIN